jgi:hypothetical protein
MAIQLVVEIKRLAPATDPGLDPNWIFRQPHPND